MAVRRALPAALIAAASLATAGSAHAAVMIGSGLANGASESAPGCAVPCTTVNTALTTQTAANGLASPVNGTVISWRFRSVNAGGSVSLRVLRAVGGVTFTGVGTSAAQSSPGGAGIHGPFATALPIQKGDFVGLNAAPPATVLVDVPATQLYWNPPLADGNSLAGTPGGPGGTPGGREVAVQALVEPTNTVTFGAVRRNKKKGTATVTLSVPNPGQLSYAGAGVNITGPASVASLGDVQLTVRATGKKAKKLKRKGKAGASFAVTFTPDFGAAGITRENLPLRKKLKKKK
jgi:hypothetical protein